MTGCYDKNPGFYYTSRGFHVQTVVIDSCEYITGYHKIAHKGNCVYCKNRREKEIEDLINKLK